MSFPPNWVAIAIGLITLVLNLVVTAATSSWVLARGRDALVAKINKRIDLVREERSTLLTEVNQKTAKMKEDLEEAIRAEGRNAGEGLAAMRTKVGQTDDRIREVELWSRDHLVSKETFTAVVAELRDGQKTIATQIDRRFDRLERRFFNGPSEDR